MKDIDLLIRILKEIIECAKRESDIICTGGYSKWDMDQLNKLVLPEMNELLAHAMEGEIFFKYGKQQRLLEASYLLTDSFEELNVTTLGSKITELQKLYNSL